MKVANQQDAPNEWDRDPYFDRSPVDTVLVGIGEELRSAYRDMTGADQPDHLVDLAHKLDALIAGSGEAR